MGILSIEQTVSVSDIGENYLLSNHGLLRMLQEAANIASNKVGHGISDIEKTGTSWVILYWRVNVLKRVEYNSALTIKTWTNFSKKLYSIRCFEVYCNDELIAKADSRWVYVDAVKHSIQKIPDELLTLYEPIDQVVFDEEYSNKFTLPQDLEPSYSYTIMKRDLDPNHHVNNIAFLDIAIEALPDNLKNEVFDDMCIVFKKELHYKDNVSCYYEEKEDSHIIYIYSNTNNILSGTIVLKKSKSC